MMFFASCSVSVNGGDAMLGVEEVGGGDGDNVDVRIVDDVTIVRGSLRDAEFILIGVQTRFIDIADGGQFAVRMVSVADAMAMPHAQSDNASLVFVVLHRLLLVYFVSGELLTGDFEGLRLLRLVAEEVPFRERHVADLRPFVVRNDGFAGEGGLLARGYVSEIEHLAV